MISFLPLIPLAYFGLYLSVIDFKTHRLPNRLVGQFAVSELGTIAVASWLTSDFTRVVKSLGIALALTAGYCLLYIFSRGAMGFGDVKFAFPLGLSLGWFAADYWLMSILGTFLIAGLVSVFGLATRRLDKNSKLALGPFMFVGTLLTLVFS